MKRTQQLNITINLMIELVMDDNEKRTNLNLVQWAYKNIRRFPKLCKLSMTSI